MLIFACKASLAEDYVACGIFRAQKIYVTWPCVSAPRQRSSFLLFAPIATSPGGALIRILCSSGGSLGNAATYKDPLLTGLSQVIPNWIGFNPLGPHFNPTSIN